eukprot:scaffold1354_cov152-Skeletonema_dohrnii-CCMP3373.AAC.1
MALSTSSSSTTRSLSWRLVPRFKYNSLCLVASLLATNFIYMAKVHYNYKFDIHLQDLANTNLPPSHNGQRENEKRIALQQPYAKTIATDIEIDPNTISELKYIATIRDDKSSPLLTVPFQSGSSETTPNVYDLLHAREALPNRSCLGCLEFVYSGVEGEASEESVDYQWAAVQEGGGANDSPNNSSDLSGWEYNFYDDDAAGEFLSLHFPPEVNDAYDSINPGAFKADLFRYCVLLIKGGIYADVDIMLESNLDAAVPPDVGFMVPMDEPGQTPDHRMCLWNGMMAAAPAHPYLARVIDRVVHNIRNRFTVVDYDQIMCNDPELSILHSHSDLFPGGPCILGMTVNEVMGRPLQQTFEHGDLITDVEVPGRTVILNQNKGDMGAHRFTWMDKNLIVAATDMPGTDDGHKESKREHYSKTFNRATLYGYDKVYTDREIAHERVVFQIHSDQDVGSIA